MMAVDQLHCAAQMLEGGEEVLGELVRHSGFHFGNPAIVWRYFAPLPTIRGTTSPLSFLEMLSRRPPGSALSVKPGPVTPVCQRCLRRMRAAVGVTYSTLSLTLQRRWAT